jgi:hypothetical protein
MLFRLLDGVVVDLWACCSIGDGGWDWRLQQKS